MIGFHDDFPSLKANPFVYLPYDGGASLVHIVCGVLIAYGLVSCHNMGRSRLLLHAFDEIHAMTRAGHTEGVLCVLRGQARHCWRSVPCSWSRNAKGGP
jgi:hypothetical protein